MKDRLLNNSFLKSVRRQLRRDQTEAEQRLWYHLRNKRLNEVKFFRQYSVGNYILDFYAPKYRMAIELDGGHHADQEQSEQDDARTDYLNAVGIKVLRFWNNDVMQNIDSVIELILAHLKVHNPS